MHQPHYDLRHATATGLHTLHQQHAQRVVRFVRNEKKQSQKLTAEMEQQLVAKVSSALLDTSFNSKKYVDEQAPKSKQTAWMAYYREQLTLLKTEGGKSAKGGGGIGNAPHISSNWKKMPEAKKKKYLEIEEKDRIRFEKEKAAYALRLKEVGDDGTSHYNLVSKVNELMYEGLVQLTERLVESIVHWDGKREAQGLEADDEALYAHLVTSFVEGSDLKKRQRTVDAKMKPDPFAPEPALNAWQLFCADARSRDAANGVEFGSMGESSKRNSSKWRTLSEEEKQVYQERAKAEKERYEQELQQRNNHIFKMIDVRGEGSFNNSNCGGSNDGIRHRCNADDETVGAEGSSLIDAAHAVATEPAAEAAEAVEAAALATSSGQSAQTASSTEVAKASKSKSKIKASKSKSKSKKQGSAVAASSGC